MSNISGTCSLIIRGKDILDFNEIEEELGISATEKYNKGDCFSKSFLIKYLMIYGFITTKYMNIRVM